ncbi:MAG: glycosyltransferase [Vicinamibacterales bacterium]
MPTPEAGPPELALILPAYNEIEGIERTLSRVHDVLAGLDFTSEVIVVDDGSTDGTGARGLEVPGAMLEHIGCGYHTLHDDIEFGYAGSWEQFALAVPLKADDGSAWQVIQDRGRNAPQVKGNSTLAGLKQYFRHVREGAVRVAASADERDVRPLAFENQDGRMVVVMPSAGAITINAEPTRLPAWARQ